MSVSLKPKNDWTNLAKIYFKRLWNSGESLKVREFKKV